MSKKSLYYLIARNRKTNDFQVIPINGKVGNLLEEIDLYTTNYSGIRELIDALYSHKVIDEKDMNLFIISQSDKQGEKKLSYLDLLFQDSAEIREVASSSLKGDISQSEGKIHDIINHFCYRMTFIPQFYNMVVYGETNLYPKFVRYFVNHRYEDFYRIKYEDGAWATKSYKLLRNIVDSFHQNDYSFGMRDSFPLDYVYRDMLEDSLLEITDQNHDEKQESIFDISPTVSEEEKKKIVYDIFQSLPKGVFIQEGNSVAFNHELFGKYDEGDLEKLCFLLGGELSLSIQMYNLHRYYYEEGMAKMKDTSRHKMMMEKEENRLHSLLDNSPDLLNQSYHWCLIYQKYCNRIVGEKGGYQYRKK